MKTNITKLSTLLVLALTSVLLITACSSDPPPPNEDVIIADLEADIQRYLSNETIDSIEIVERNTDTENGNDTVHVMVESHSDEVANTRYFTLRYSLIEFDDESRWVLDNIAPHRENAWVSIPLSGADESLFRNVIIGLSINIDGEDWFINDESLDSITVSSRITDLEQGQDTVIVDVVLSSAALTANGQVELDFVFDDGWRSDGHKMHTAFTSEFHPHAVLDMSDEQVMNKLVEMRQFVFSSGNTEQHVYLNHEQISNLSSVSATTSNKGTHKVFEHTFNLHKELVDFEIDIRSIYNFDALSGWNLQDIQLSPKVTAVRLDGTVWGGIYTHGGNHLLMYSGSGPILRGFTLEITVLPAVDGMRGKLTELSSPIYSQYLFGRSVDFENLSIHLAFEEWIIEPTWTNRHGRPDNSANRASGVTFFAFINVENSTIVHTRGGNTFEVMTRQEAPPPVADIAEEYYNDE